MVLCQFYLSNNCRFGSKCVNEHFDVKQIIKTEVEAAIKGTQWPLSCFGPFKEKPCLPNFINDQSFEEIRHLCYEAKKQNNLQAYAQQFTQEVMGAQNRMKALLSLSRDVIDAVVNLYNSQDPNANQQGQKSNPFSLGGGGVGFGQPQANNGTANAVFGGGSTTQANPFANSGFGGVPQSTSSIFGGTNTATVASNGLFGQQAGFANANTFGAPNASIFGGAQQQQQQPQQQTQQLGAFALPQIGGNPQTNQTTSPFSMQPQVNAFGNQPENAFPAQNVAPQTGLFSQQQSNQMQPTGLFGQVGIQQQQVPPQNIGFGSPSVPQGSGLFGQSAVAPGQSIFGGNIATTPQQQTPFGSQMQMQQPQQQQPQAQVGFGMQQSNIFASPQLQQQQQQQQQQQHHPTATTPGSLFGGGGQANNFQQNAPPSFGTQNNMGQLTTANSNISDTAYSRMEDLSPEVLEAFRSPEFVLGKMPTVPPPRELC